MIVSCEASSKFHKRRFQNERFARGFLEISQKKVPKRAFCAMLPTISQKKLPKGSFRAMLPTIFTEKTSKRTESLKWKKIPQKNGKKFPEKFWTLREYKGSSPLKGQVGSLLVMMISFWRGCVKNQHFARGGSVHNASSMLSHVDSVPFTNLRTAVLQPRLSFQMPGGALPYPMSPILGVPHL